MTFLWASGSYAINNILIFYKMLNLLKNIAIKLIESRNSKLVDEIGTNSQINGAIDKRNNKSRIRIGNECLISGTLVCETENSEIIIGDNVFIGGKTILDSATRIEIENDVLISYECLVQDSDNHNLSFKIRKNDLKDWKQGGKHNWELTPKKPVLIKKEFG